MRHRIVIKWQYDIAIHEVCLPFSFHLIFKSAQQENLLCSRVLIYMWLFVKCRMQAEENLNHLSRHMHTAIRMTMATVYIHRHHIVQGALKPLRYVRGTGTSLITPDDCDPGALTFRNPEVQVDELAGKHEDEQHPAASSEKQPVLPHGLGYQPSAMRHLRQEALESRKRGEHGKLN